MPNLTEISRMIDDYDILLDKYGDSEKSVGWNKPKHNIRFNAIIQPWVRIFGRSNASILDFGCGLGHLFKYMRREDIMWNYRGVDINRRLIERARDRFLDNADSFQVVSNIDDLKGTVDLVAIVGVFNRRFEDSDAFCSDVIQKALTIATTGVAISALAPWALKKNISNYYMPLSLIEKLVDRSIVKSIDIDGSSLHGEIQIHFYKNL